MIRISNVDPIPPKSQKISIPIREISKSFSQSRSTSESEISYICRRVSKLVYPNSAALWVSGPPLGKFNSPNLFHKLDGVETTNPTRELGLEEKLELETEGVIFDLCQESNVKETESVVFAIAKMISLIPFLSQSNPNPTPIPTC